MSVDPNFNMTRGPSKRKVLHDEEDEEGDFRNSPTATQITPEKASKRSKFIDDECGVEKPDENGSDSSDDEEEGEVEHDDLDGFIVNDDEEEEEQEEDNNSLSPRGKAKKHQLTKRKKKVSLESSDSESDGGEESDDSCSPSNPLAGLRSQQAYIREILTRLAKMGRSEAMKIAVGCANVEEFERACKNAAEDATLNSSETFSENSGEIMFYAALDRLCLYDPSLPIDQDEIPASVSRLWDDKLLPIPGLIPRSAKNKNKRTSSHLDSPASSHSSSNEEALSARPRKRVQSPREKRGQTAPPPSRVIGVLDLDLSSDSSAEESAGEEGEPAFAGSWMHAIDLIKKYYFRDDQDAASDLDPMLLAEIENKTKEIWTKLGLRFKMLEAKRRDDEWWTFSTSGLNDEALEKVSGKIFRNAERSFKKAGSKAQQRRAASAPAPRPSYSAPPLGARGERVPHSPRSDDDGPANPDFMDNDGTRIIWGKIMESVGWEETEPVVGIAMENTRRTLPESKRADYDFRKFISDQAMKIGGNYVRWLSAKAPDRKPFKEPGMAYQYNTKWHEIEMSRACRDALEKLRVFIRR